MPANYGYGDGSGDFFITLDTDKCNGCGDCATVCPADVFEVPAEDPNDPFRDDPLAAVKQDKRNKIKYECAECKPTSDRPPLPCVQACKEGAIEHSW